MLSILYAEVNIVGAAFLLFMLTNKNSNKLKDISLDQKIFNIIMFSNLLILIFDTGMWVMDGRTFTGAKAALNIVTVIYVLLATAMCLLCLLYADYRIYENKSRLMKRLWLYSVPAIISAFMAISSPFTGWFFIIKPENIYSRGKLFIVFVIISFIYLFSASGMAINDIIKNGWQKNKNVDFPLLIFFTAIITASIIQVKFYGASLIWITSALACGYNYINIQNGVISTDYITGLNNRRRLDLHLQRRIQSWNGDSMVFAVILDVDDFKKINDTYGHLSGDKALSCTADILRKSCRSGMDFIARMGGDEFIIIGERLNADEIKQLLEDIDKNFNEFNSRDVLEYNLFVSMGYS
ncbi:sensor domain-containing diguanylate cyclase, partial [bacterium]|nr:sensor domain-containing diguanylate cyclase [bacterium]